MASTAPWVGPCAKRKRKSLEGGSTVWPGSPSAYEIGYAAVAVFLYVLGAMLSLQVLQLIGTILFAHSTLDRVFHFGLKYGDRFAHTHLGE